MSSPQSSKSAAGHVIIAGTGRYNPAHVLTNEELERRVDTSDEWITSRTGIKERRIAAAGEHNSDMATKAALSAMENAKVKASEVDLIICGTVTGDMPFPATSCLVQKNLGAHHATAFDVGAACTGFIYGMEIGRQLIHAGNYRTAVVIGSERISSITDWTDRNTCVLFGDGSGAVVLQRRDTPSRGILATDTGSDGRYAHILHQPGGGTRIPITTANVHERLATLHMSGKEVFKQAVSSMTSACQNAMAKAGVTIDDIALVIPHQANYRIIDAVGEKLKAPPERVYKNVQRYGNTGAAAVAMALDEAHREGRFQRGDKILLVAFGAGLTWGATVIEW